MTTILTTILFMTYFKKIEGVKIEAGLFWGLVLSFSTLLASSVYWFVVLGGFILFSVCTLFIGPLLLIRPIARNFSKIATAPVRFVGEIFPGRLSFESDKGAEELTAWIFVLSIFFGLFIG